MTAPARGSFYIIARHKGLGSGVGFVLPVKARVRPHKLGVSVPSEAWCILRGASPRRERASHPPVASVASWEDRGSDGMQVFEARKGKPGHRRLLTPSRLLEQA